VAALLGVAVALVLVLSLTSRRTSKPPVSSLNAATPGPSSSAGAEVRLNIRAQPVTAALVLDGKPLGQNPYSGAQPRDQRQHELVVSAAGHQARTLSIQLDRDVDLEVGLAEAQAAQSGGPTPTPSSTPITRKNPVLGVQRPRAPALSKKPGEVDADPYRDLPSRKSAGNKPPPLDTSESPW